LESGLERAGLVVGCARSYGDSGLSASGTSLGTTSLNRFIAFDDRAGTLRCESGVTLGDILALTLPRGWVLPVLPGTRFVSVGGAIANDIHGKNHPRAGSFGCHLLSLELLRSDGTRLHCSAVENADWFAATIGGLGLTGAIVSAELQLQPVAGGWLDTTTTRFTHLEEFFELAQASGHEYNAAWVDCLSGDSRGHFSAASHSERGDAARPPAALFTVPFTPPVSPVNRFSLRLFNELYYRRQLGKRVEREQSLYAWFFPLDRVQHWNRLYGRRGFRQYQCVVPAVAIGELLAIIRRAGEGSFLAVLKHFGDRESPGLLSFPRPGATFALDFPWRGQRTLELFAALDDWVLANAGAVYPAKDAHMSPALFRAAYPAWQRLESMRDPQLNSLFWQRVTAE
jgi:FAD/FMN-containing dehydrogenase